MLRFFTDIIDSEPEYIKCSLPWTNLRLTTSYSTVCCWSHLSNQKPDSIWSIWNGEYFRTLRQEMKHPESFKSCGWNPDSRKTKVHCGKKDPSTDSIWRPSYPLSEKQKSNLDRCRLSYKNDEIVVEHYPLVLNILTNLSCNLMCEHCCQLNVKKTPDYDLDAILPELEPFLNHAILLYLQGGEALISRNYDKIIDATRKAQGAKIKIVTNGTMIEKKVIPHLDLYEVICVSIDAASKATFENIRTGGRWEHLIENLDALRASGYDRCLIFLFTIMSNNIHEMSAMIELAHRYGASANFSQISSKMRRYKGKDYTLPSFPLHKMLKDNHKQEIIIAAKSALELSKQLWVKTSMFLPIIGDRLNLDDSIY